MERRVLNPLKGLRIISVEHFAAAPYGTMLLAALGAEVIKVETKEGDPSRRIGPHLLGEGDSHYFQTWNLNKKSVSLDLKDSGDRARFERLVGSAEAIVNNLRGDQPAKLGLDYAALSKIKPAIVCVHVSAYGRDNERAAWPGYDYLMQAEAGLMSLTGEPGAPPSRFGSPSQIDYCTGMTAMIGLLSAVMGARATGQGCDLDVSLYDVALHQLGYVGSWFLNAGDVVERQPRSAHFSVAPSQTFPTSDGWIFIMCMTERFWDELTECLARTDLRVDPRFATMRSRFENRKALTDVLDGEFRKHTTAEWTRALSGRLPVGPVRTIDQALSDDFVRRSGMVQSVPHPADPAFRALAAPFKIDGERPPLRVCPPLGADNDSVIAADCEA